MKDWVLFLVYYFLYTFFWTVNRGNYKDHYFYKNIYINNYYPKVKDWDLMESLWGFGLNNRLRIDPKEYALLMVEPSFNTRQNREKLTELIFEKYEAPALFLAKDAVLSCFACGRTTVLVIDSGGGKTSTQAVYEGYVLQQSIRRSPFASMRLDNELLLHLQSRYPDPPIIPSYQITKRDIGAGKFKVTLHQFPNTHPSYSNFRLLVCILLLLHLLPFPTPSLPPFLPFLPFPRFPRFLPSLASSLPPFPPMILFIPYLIGFLPANILQ